MTAFHPRLDDLPAEFAVFPLPGALLMPRGKLPLNVFEPRYLAMVQDSLTTGRMFGMIQPDPTGPEGTNGPALYRIGCLGRLSSFNETDDGRLVITLTGVIRFRVAEELAMRNGYRRVRGDFSRYTDDLRIPPAPVDIKRDKIMTALRTYFAQRSVDANWDAIKAMTDDTLVVTLAMVCPFEPVEKQAVLEAETDADRAATLLTLLQMGAAGPGAPTHVS